MSDGIEIHYDDKRGYLELACEPDAFAQYREVARQQLSDFPEIEVDKVLEISIVDTTRFVARRSESRHKYFGIIVGAAVCGIVFLAVIGVISLVKWAIA